MRHHTSFLTYAVLLVMTMGVASCGSRQAVRTDFPFKFNDNNPHQLASAQKYGIEPLEDRSELPKVIKKLKRIEDSDEYAIDPLTHSVPYLTKDAAKLLRDIGKGFRKSLRKHKMGDYKIIVTSVLRTKEDVRKLMKVNSNAVPNSAHCHATTFDITYRRYKHLGGQENDPKQMKYLLGEVLEHLREKGRCHVRYETQQTCLHITVSK